MTSPSVTMAACRHVILLALLERAPLAVPTHSVTHAVATLFGDRATGVLAELIQRRLVAPLDLGPCPGLALTPLGERMARSLLAGSGEEEVDDAHVARVAEAFWAGEVGIETGRRLLGVDRATFTAAMLRWGNEHTTGAAGLTPTPPLPLTAPLPHRPQGLTRAEHELRAAQARRRSDGTDGADE